MPLQKVTECEEFDELTDVCRLCRCITPRWQRRPRKDPMTGEQRGEPLVTYFVCAYCAAKRWADEQRGTPHVH